MGCHQQWPVMASNGQSCSALLPQGSPARSLVLVQSLCFLLCVVPNTSPVMNSSLYCSTEFGDVRMSWAAAAAMLMEGHTLYTSSEAA